MLIKMMSYMPKGVFDANSNGIGVFLSLIER
jgi:hypothetical protein